MSGFLRVETGEIQGYGESPGRLLGARLNTGWVNPLQMRKQPLLWEEEIAFLKVMSTPTRYPHRRYKFLSTYNSVNSTMVVVSPTEPKLAYN